ncbi:serine/threonine-protein phosphatase PGAM5, mitochondrial-like isoform X3 [Gordionus sp. m RMFG-2023]|uniref:serine/threonine-protein phosphatase PGAM5, mitochondrial-like isoform X3 n=1 Tax=Gordionus sp. m RMFG-2023 TaxID=3053472 RepID=UPI0031FE1661
MVIFTKLCSRFSKFLTGASVGAGLALITYGLYNKDKFVAYAQWNIEQSCTIRWDDNWDKSPSNMIKPPKNEKEKEIREEKILRSMPSSSRYLFLIRHGQYNLEGSSDFERELTSLGQNQAQITGERLREFNHPFARIFHSSMTRAKQTAEFIHKNFPDLPLVSCDLLREGAPVPPEPAIKHWKPEASEFFQQGIRIEAAFRKYFHRAHPEQTQDSYEIIVCHANVIRYFVCRALQLPAQAWLRMSLNNGSITMITIRPDGRVLLRALGDSGHIPATKVTNT